MTRTYPPSNRALLIRVLVLAVASELIAVAVTPLRPGLVLAVRDLARLRWSGVLRDVYVRTAPALGQQSQ